MFTTPYQSNFLNRLQSVYRLVRVSDVQEKVLLVVFLIKRSHCSRGRRNDVVDKKEKRVLWSETDPLSDQEVKLTHSQVRGNQVLFLVEITNSSFWRLFHDNWNSVWILSSDLFPFSSPLLEGVFFLVLPLHAEE